MLRLANFNNKQSPLIMKFEKYFAQCEQFKKVKVLALNLPLCFLSNWKGEILLLLYARHLWPSATPGNWPSWLYSDPINKAKKQTNIILSVFHHTGVLWPESCLQSLATEASLLRPPLTGCCCGGGERTSRCRSRLLSEKYIEQL